MMKKLLIFLTLIIVIVGSIVYFSSDNKVTIDYRKSDIYTQDDMDNAIAVIRKEFDSWKGCKLYRISYTSDKNNNQENVAWMNELANGKANYTQCIQFISDFRSPLFGGDGWDANAKYTNWQWWLARKDNGKWELLTWGYG